MKKSLGDIAKEAYGKELRKSQSWEAAAAAIVEECTKALCWDCHHGDLPKFDPDAGMYLHENEGQLPRGCAASELYSLKASRSQSQIEERSDEVEAEDRSASLTHKTEDGGTE